MATTATTAVMTEATTVVATIPNAPTGVRKPDIAKYNGVITPTYSVTGRSHEPTGPSGDTSTKRASIAMPRAGSIVPMSSVAGAERQDLSRGIAGIDKVAVASLS